METMRSERSLPMVGSLPCDDTILSMGVSSEPWSSLLLQPSKVPLNFKDHQTPRGVPGAHISAVSWPFWTGEGSLESGRLWGPFAGGPATGGPTGVRECTTGGPESPYLGRFVAVSNDGEVVGTGHWPGNLCGVPTTGGPKGGPWGVPGDPWSPCARPVDLLFSGKLCPVEPRPWAWTRGLPLGPLPGEGRHLVATHRHCTSLEDLLFSGELCPL